MAPYIPTAIDVARKRASRAPIDTWTHPPGHNFNRVPLVFQPGLVALTLRKETTDFTATLLHFREVVTLVVARLAVHWVTSWLMAIEFTGSTGPRRGQGAQLATTSHRKADGGGAKRFI